MNSKNFSKYAYILVLAGALNLGLNSLLKLNLITILFGSTGLEDIVYILIGASAVYLIATYNSKKK